MQTDFQFFKQQIPKKTPDESSNRKFYVTVITLLHYLVKFEIQNMQSMQRKISSFLHQLLLLLLLLLLLHLFNCLFSRTTSGKPVPER